MSDKSDEESVLGSLPATRPTRFGRERRESGGNRDEATVAKPRPQEGRAEGGGAQAGARHAKPRPVRAGAPALRESTERARTAEPPPGVEDHAARAAPSSSPPPSRRRASWPRSASRSAARCSGARSTGSPGPSDCYDFPRAESAGFQPGERGTQCGSVVRGGESAGLPVVALLSLREPVSSPRRQRRKPMRTLTTRIVRADRRIRGHLAERARAGAVRRRRRRPRRARARACAVPRSPAAAARCSARRCASAAPSTRSSPAARSSSSPSTPSTEAWTKQAKADGQAGRHVRRALEARARSASSAPVR